MTIRTLRDQRARALPPGAASAGHLLRPGVHRQGGTAQQSGAPGGILHRLYPKKSLLDLCARLCGRGHLRHHHLEAGAVLQMIADAHRGSLISLSPRRSPGSPLHPGQHPLHPGAAGGRGGGVLFQNDNINTLDTDSEFRLVVMAGVAQDEVRKLSERLKFGFRQAIKNGHVLGNDRLWGYDKRDCKLTVNPEQARAVQLIFALYATGKIRGAPWPGS